MNTSLPVLTAAKMRLCDEHTIRELHIPSRTLMERAARAAVSCLLGRPSLFPQGSVLVLCGSGNNGGDGLAAARFLADGSQGESRPVTVVYLGRLTPEGLPDTDRMSQECARQYALARQAGIPVLPPDRATDALSGCSAVVDAVFGIGLDRPVEGAMGAFLRRVAETGRPVLAIDIPSGVYTDTGAVPGAALSAAVTVTMQALKPGLLLYPGAALCGDGDFLLAGEVLARQGVGVCHDLLRGARGHHLATVDARAGTDVDEIIGGTHGILIVLHHQKGVAHVP